MSIMKPGKPRKPTAKQAPPASVAQENVLEDMVFRHDYYRDRAVALTRLTVLLAIITALSLLLAMVMALAGREVLVVDMEGRTLPTLEEAVVTRPQLLAFAANAITCPHNLTFLRYASELESCSAHFTPGGWSSFEKSVITAGYLDRLVDEKGVSSAVPLRPPVVLQEAIDDGRRVWLISMDVLVEVYAGAGRQQQKNEIRVIVRRVPLTDHTAGIAVTQYLARRLT